MKQCGERIGGEYVAVAPEDERWLGRPIGEQHVKAGGELFPAGRLTPPKRRRFGEPTQMLVRRFVESQRGGESVDDLG